MPGGPGQEPLGRVVGGNPAWSWRIMLSPGEAWFLLYRQYRLSDVAWPCPVCGAPGGLHLVGKKVGRSFRFWLRCDTCRKRLDVARRPIHDLNAELGVPFPP